MTNLDPILRRPEVERIVGIGRSTIYQWVSAGLFPRPIRLGARCVGWRSSDVQSWLESRSSSQEA